MPTNIDIHVMVILEPENHRKIHVANQNGNHLDYPKRDAQKECPKDTLHDR